MRALAIVPAIARTNGCGWLVGADEYAAAGDPGRGDAGAPRFPAVPPYLAGGDCLECARRSCALEMDACEASPDCRGHLECARLCESNPNCHQDCNLPPELLGDGTPPWEKPGRSQARGREDCVRLSCESCQLGRDLSCVGSYERAQIIDVRDVATAQLVARAAASFPPGSMTTIDFAPLSKRELELVGE